MIYLINQKHLTSDFNTNYNNSMEFNEQIIKIKNDKEFLNSLNIYELRGVARELGINNASLYKKKDLIERIYLSEPKENLVHRGRPTKDWRFLKSLNYKEIESLQSSDDIERLQKIVVEIKNLQIEMLAIFDRIEKKL